MYLSVVIREFLIILMFADEIKGTTKFEFWVYFLKQKCLAFVRRVIFTETALADLV